MTRIISILLILLMALSPGLVHAQDSSSPEVPQETTAPTEVEAPAEVTETATEAAKDPDPAPVAEPTKKKEPPVEKQTAKEDPPAQAKVGLAVVDVLLPEEMLGVTKGIVADRLNLGLSTHYDISPEKKSTQAVQKAGNDTPGLECPSETCDGKLRDALKVDRLVFLEGTQEKVTLKLKLTMRRSAGNLTNETECVNCTAVELESKIDAMVAELVAKDDALPPQPEAMAKGLPDDKAAAEPDKPGFRMPIWGWALAGGAAIVLLAALGGGGDSGGEEPQPDSSTGTVEFTW